MIALCVNNICFITNYNDLALTINKIYEVEEAFNMDDKYYVINDDGDKTLYYRCRFKPIYEIREEKLKELGI